jgi:hypothetical protein
MELINFNEFMRRMLGGASPGTTVNPILGGGRDDAEP